MPYRWRSCKRKAFLCRHDFDAFDSLALLAWCKVYAPGQYPLEKAGFVHIEDTTQFIILALLADGRHATCDLPVIDAARFAMQHITALVVSVDGSFFTVFSPSARSH